jgi:hypothetical protein
MSRFCGLCVALAAACGGGGGFPDAAQDDAPPPPTGQFSVMWSIVDQNNQPITCDRLAGSTMNVLAHNLAFGSGVPVVFTCTSGMGTSIGLVPGTYEMDFELQSSFGLLARGLQQVPIQIAANATTPLEPVKFQVEALGGVALKVASGKPGGNCGAVNANGAGIDQMSITMTHNSDGSCRPIQLTISDGATQPGGTYMINCTTPVDRGCIEADQVISATGIPSDSYTIRVRGKIATKACWANNDTIQVPPLSKTLLRTLNLAQTQTAGCP